MAGDGGSASPVASPVSAVELEIPPRLEFLALARALVIGAAGMNGPWGRHRLADLEIAVSEACANAIHAQRVAQQTDPILIRCTPEDDSLSVRIVDHGPGMDTSRLQRLPPATERVGEGREGGFGLPLIYRLADDVRIESSPSGTAVQILLRRRGRDSQ